MNEVVVVNSEARTTPQAVYSAASHNLSMPYVTESEWKTSFAQTLLLDGTLAVPDAALIGSPHLCAHVLKFLKQGEKSWVEVALQEGWLHPFFRDVSCTPLEAYEMGTADEHRGYHPDAKIVASALSDIVPQKYPWPDVETYCLGEKYDEKLSETFQEEHCGNVLSDLFGEDIEDYDRFWETRESWRVSWLEKARAETTKRKQGIQLSRLLDVAAAELLSPGSEKVKSIADLLSRLQAELKHGHGLTRDKYLVSDLKRYFKVACELYVCNQAEGFDLRNAFINLDRWSLITSVRSFRKRNLPAKEEAERIVPFGVRIALPRADELMNIPGQILRDIRRTPEAIKYYNELKLWQAAPDESATRKCLKSLKEYANRICELTKGKAAPRVHVGYVAALSALSVLAPAAARSLQIEAFPATIAGPMGGAIAIGVNLLKNAPTEKWIARLRSPD